MPDLAGRNEDFRSILSAVLQQEWTQVLFRKPPGFSTSIHMSKQDSVTDEGVSMGSNVKRYTTQKKLYA